MLKVIGGISVSVVLPERLRRCGHCPGKAHMGRIREPKSIALGCHKKKESVIKFESFHEFVDFFT